MVGRMYMCMSDGRRGNMMEEEGGIEDGCVYFA